MQTVELKVEMVGIHEKRVRKCLSKLKGTVLMINDELLLCWDTYICVCLIIIAGIDKVEVEAKSEKVVVMGYAHKNRILKAIRRSGLKADFWSPQNELLQAYAANFTFNKFSFFNWFNNKFLHWISCIYSLIHNLVRTYVVASVFE